MEKFLVWVEKTGNRLLHPFWMFVYMGVFVLVLSLILGLLGVSVVHPVSNETITVKNLVSEDGLQRFVLEMVTAGLSSEQRGVLAAIDPAGFLWKHRLRQCSAFGPE